VARPDHPRSVYLDSCCYIDWAEGKDSCAEVVTWLRAAHSGKVKIIASTAMFAEARATGNGRPDPAAEKRIRALLQEPYVALVDVTRRVGLLSRDLAVERPKVKGMDALHLATAIDASAEVFLSRDLKAFSTGELYRGVWIETPYEFGGEGLFPMPGE
jgi:predicted nucleic acid-binding protein